MYESSLERNMKQRSWRNLISESDIKQNLLTPVFYSAQPEEPVLPGLSYGYRVDKRFAPTPDLDAGAWFDPVHFLCRRSLASYDSLADGFGESFGLRVQGVVFDGETLYTMYKINGDLEDALDFFDYLCNFFGPGEGYSLQGLALTIPGRRSDSGNDELFFYLHWDSSPFGGLAPELIQEQGIHIMPGLKLLSVEPSSHLILNKKRGGQICWLCTEPGYIGCHPEVAEKIDEWNWGKVSSLPAGLTPGEKETLLRGTHEWCYESSMSEL